MRNRSVLLVCLTIAAAGLFAGCSDPLPTTPSQPTPSEFAGIQVMGPDSVAAGQSAQFVANIRQADGTTKSVMSMPNLIWRSSNTSAMSVSNSGVVTAAPSAFGGEAMITAEISPGGAVQGTRKVVVPLKAVVTFALEVSEQGTPGQISYTFDVTLTESGGGPATVTALWISFDDNSGGQCFWIPYTLGQTRLPANGTLALGPLTCDNGHEKAFNVTVSVSLIDDNGYETQLTLLRKL